MGVEDGFRPEGKWARLVGVLQGYPPDVWWKSGLEGSKPYWGQEKDRLVRNDFPEADELREEARWKAWLAQMNCPPMVGIA